jgi:GNAT superfamily N-acetyltransferase
MAELRIEPVTEVAWSDVEKVFGTRGDPAGCWCQWFKLSSEQWKSIPRSECAERLHEQAATRPGPGLLAFLEDEPVAWCGVEPRTSFTRLVDGDDPSVWAITCFVVRVGYRKRGIGAKLVLAAIEHARANGARLVEGYPTDASGKKMSSADLYRGTVSMFEAAGFTRHEHPAPTRATMRLELVEH